MAPFLKNLADAGALNATVTAQQAKDAETFNKRLAELQTNAGDAARALGLEYAGHQPGVRRGGRPRCRGDTPLHDANVPLQAVTVLGARTCSSS
ncbi:MAG: hypothetical protein MZW92_24580 [Comamonadaceae bacterium]|nr:hypothetical protein [Comamonadaceae bacterium]